jgi:asparagine synthase (glutamine-hydrolysing)
VTRRGFALEVDFDAVASSGGPAPSAAAVARLDDFDALRRAIGRPDADAAATIAALHRRDGTRCVDALHGEFAFASWDPQRRELLCARDPFGVEPLYYAHDPARRRFACATDVAALLALAWVDDALRAERVLRFLDGRLDAPSATFHERVRRLPPGHRLVVDRDRLRVERWFTLEAPQPLRLREPRDYEEALRERLRIAVERRLDGASAPALFASGGLDSSVLFVLACDALARVGAPPPAVYSLTFGDTPDCDERRHVEALLAATSGGAAHFVDARRLDPFTTAESSALEEWEPVAAPNDHLYRALLAAARERGTDLVLDGTDGDSVVSHGFGRFAELLARGHFATLAREAREFAAASGRTPRDVVRKLALRPVAKALALHAPSFLRPAWRARPWRRGVPTPSLAREELARSVGTEGRADLEPPLDAYFTERESHRLNLSTALHGDSLEALARAASSSGVELRHPMFDLDLARFCLSLPAEQKLADGWTRHVLRRAATARLPASIAWRRRKSDLSPHFTESVCARVCALSPDAVVDAIRPAEEFVDARRLQWSIDLLRSRHDSEVAYAVWRAFALALWLRGRQSRRRNRCPHPPQGGPP